MTQEERIELLRKVAEVAPKEMRARMSNDGDSVFFAEDPAWLELCGIDSDDAQAIIAMLDAMEGLGFNVWVGRHVYCDNPETKHLATDGYCCDGYIIGTGERFFALIGKTRAEAVARAFVEVFSTGVR